MKKTLIALMTLVGVAGAETTYDLAMEDVTFGTDPALSSGNRVMKWVEDGTTAAYKNWYMEFQLSTVTATGYKASITAGATDHGNSTGLSVSAKSDAITLGSGNTDVIDGAGSLSFDTSDTLTFAYYDGVAYLGNKDKDTYISVNALPEDLTTTMTSGTSHAWSNSGSTQIGATKIASLDNLEITAGEQLDMATLMIRGVAKSVSVVVPEPATTTLSLLALVGLAARRRRK